MSADLRGALVLVPRPHPADPVARAVTDAGGRPLTTALVRTALPEPDHLDAALRALAAGAHRWLAVTSATTVEILAERATHLGTSLAELSSGTAVAAVGPATATALRAHGVRVDLLPPAESSAAALAAAWPEADGHGIVLLPRSARAAPTLAAGLRERGWLVDDVIAYDTRTALEPDPGVAAALSDLDAVVLTSGSTAEALVELYGPPPRAVVCAIGTSTAAAARAAGLRVDTVARDQTPAGLVEAVAEALAARPGVRPAPAPEPTPAPEPAPAPARPASPTQENR